MSAEGATAASVVSDCAAAESHNAKGATADGETADGGTAERHKTQRAPADCDDATRQATDGQATGCDIANGDDALRVTSNLTSFNIRPHRKVVQRKSHDGDRGLLPHASHHLRSEKIST